VKVRTVSSHDRDFSVRLELWRQGADYEPDRFGVLDAEQSTRARYAR
jgi:hypothetical protein